MNLLRLWIVRFLVSICLFSISLYADIVWTPQEKHWIESHPVVVVGGGPDWAPFDFVVDGVYNGIAKDYLDIISQKTGLKFEIVIDKWKNNLSKMKNKKIDLLGAVYYTKQRSEFMHFTQSYFQMLDYFFIRDDLKLSSIKDLDGHIVAIPKGYAHAIIIEKVFPKIKILWVDTFSDAIDAVLEHKADILFDTYVSVQYSLKKAAVNTIIPFKAYRGKEVMKLHMAANIDEPILADIINKALKDISPQEKEKIYKKWIDGNFITPTNSLKLTKTEKDWLKQHKIVTVGIDKEWKPFDFLDKYGKHNGLSQEYLSLITQKTGLEFKIVTYPKWSMVVKALKDKDIDMISAITYLKEREDCLDFSRGYLEYGFAIVTHRSQQFFYTLDEFANKKIGVVQGYATEDILLKHYPNMKIHRYINIPDMLKGLDKNEVDAVFDNSVSLAYYIKSGGYTYFMMSAASDIPKQQVSIGVAKDNKILLSIINKALQSITPLEHKNIYEKWVSFDFAKVVDYEILYKVITIFVLLIIGLLYWNRKIKQAQRQLLQLLEAIPLQIIVTNKYGVIQDLNSKAIESIGKKEELLGNFIDIVYADDNIYPDIYQQLLDYNLIEKEMLRYKYKDQTVHDMLVSIVPFKYLNKIYFIHISVDVTQHIQYEKQLQEANEIKSRFLANVSHEIRTPINAIIGFSDMLQKELEDLKFVKYINSINNAGKKLLHLVNEILDASKIEANKIEIIKKQTDIYNLISEIEEVFALSVTQKGLKFDINIQDKLPSSIIIDEVKVYQVLINLISNALKFTKDGYIKLDVSFKYIKDNTIELVFKVEDSGIGIQADQLEKIFEPFQQQEKQDEKIYGGTGLGLYIVNQYVEMMDGAISVISNAQGSTFIVTLSNVEVLTQNNTKIFAKKYYHQVSDVNIKLLFDSLASDELEKLQKAYKDVRATNNISYIKYFIDILADINDKYHIEVLSLYIDELQIAYESFDISKIEDIFDKFKDSFV